MDIPNAVVSANNVHIDGVKLPGLIVEDSVTATADETGRYTLLTVTFAVSSVKYARRYREYEDG